MSAASAPATEIYSPGLEGVIAGETAVSTVEGGLRYRGYPVTELCQYCNFDEVAFLMLYGELPTPKQLTDFQSRVSAARKLPECLRPLLAALPRNVSPMDVIRTSISVLSHFDPDVNDSSPEANLRKAERLYAQIPLAVADQFHLSKGKTPVAPRSDLGAAAHFMYLVRGKEATPEEVRAFDVSLILYAEHEFNASTFTARVVVSTESDLHSGVVAAVGALKGRLHGGANEKVMDVVNAAGGPKNAEAWTLAALAKKERIMGFGHRVYKSGDVRAGVLKAYSAQMAGIAGTSAAEETAEIIETVMAREKNMYPNLDWPAGRLYHALGLEIPIYTPIFVMSRITGWAAHINEQLAKNRLIRPRGRYTGPDVRSVPAKTWSA
ncbi:MAG: citrate synthase [Gemmataceae bacterium]|nr:citrate synthase [Gemmataceae bacterium]